MLYRLFAILDIKPNDVGVPEVPLSNSTLGTLLTLTFTVIGALATLFLLIGAVRYVTSNGDQANLKQAKNTILYSLIGMVVSLSAFTIVQFLLGVFK